jgi:AraC family transcriptional regulator, transcriptional activator FtrA
MQRAPNRRVTLLAYDYLSLFEFGVAAEVFGLPRPELGVDWYQLRVAALDKGPLRATGGVTVRSDASIDALRRAGTIIVPGWRDLDERPPEPLLRALRAAHARGARLVSICRGAFVLAAAGLLDGRRATTHWRHAEELRQRYPRVRVEPDVLFVDEGTILTSAGSAAGIDLCLHVVREDYGADVANRVARRLVVAPLRDGGQAQFIPAPVPGTTASGLALVLQRVTARLHERLDVASLARLATMSPRTFARRFRDETGTTPHQWLTHQRVLAARRLLETSEASVDRIARDVGLETGATLRLHFRRVLRTTPTAYRRQFPMVASKRQSPARSQSGPGRGPGAGG